MKKYRPLRKPLIIRDLRFLSVAGAFMMTHRPRWRIMTFRVPALCLLLFIICLPLRPAGALSVDSLRFGDHSGKTRMVLELSAPSKFRAFVLSDPYRIVVDLPAFDWKVKGILGPTSGAIKEIRHGVLESGVSRLVVDVSGPIIIRSAFLLPPADGQHHRLVVDFSGTDPAEAQKALKTVYGSLESGALSKVPSTTLSAPIPPSKTLAAKPAAEPEAPRSFPPPKPAHRKPLIIIDPGHGGDDPGAIGANNVREKQVTLAAARELKRQLEASGRYTVHLTRGDDRFIKLQKRVAIAREKGGDLFISLHADSIDKAGVRGASIYTLSDKASDEQTARLAKKENMVDLIAGVDLSHEDADVANILIDLAMRETMNQSKFFANTVVGKLSAAGIRTLEKPHRYAGFAVLKAPDIPSVLIEIGFMSNAREVAMLTSPDYQRKIGESLARSIDAYFDKIHGNSSH